MEKEPNAENKTQQAAVHVDAHEDRALFSTWRRRRTAAPPSRRSRDRASETSASVLARRPSPSYLAPSVHVGKIVDGNTDPKFECCVLQINNSFFCSLSKPLAATLRRSAGTKHAIGRVPNACGWPAAKWRHFAHGLEIGRCGRSLPFWLTGLARTCIVTDCLPVGSPLPIIVKLGLVERFLPLWVFRRRHS